MPFYTYVAEDGEEIEEFLNMSEMKDEIISNGKTFKRKPEFSKVFHLKGTGWVSKNTQHMVGGPKRSIADVGYKIDYDKKREMEA